MRSPRTDPAPGATVAVEALRPAAVPASPLPGQAVAPADHVYPTFPPTLSGRPVRTVTQAIADATNGSGVRPVVIEGYLGVPRAIGGCTDPAQGVIGPACERRGLLAQGRGRPPGPTGSRASGRTCTRSCPSG